MYHSRVHSKPLYIFVGRPSIKEINYMCLSEITLLACTCGCSHAHKNMSWLFRDLTSLSTRSFHEPDLNLKLDLAYITPQLIVCSGPVSSYLKSWYRYTTTDLAQFLNHKHATNGHKYWRIWNFRAEGPGYSMKEFKHRVDYRPFPDHQPPPINLLIRCVQSIDEFLSKDPCNVAVLHCKAGKGRSGTITCAYLMYKQAFLTPQAANNIFTSRRMNLYFGDGVSILSQKMYLDYWNTLLLERQGSDLLQPLVLQSTIVLKDILLYAIKGSFTIRLKAYREEQEGKQLIELFSKDLSMAQRGIDVRIEIPFLEILPCKDLYLVVSRSCSTWFCPYFCQEQSFSANWESFDGYLGLQLRGPRLFDKLQIRWSLE